jgi:ketosteroid isomerase-like protein
MNTKITEVIAASQDALVAFDLDRYLSLFAEDAEVIDPSLPPLRGRDALRAFLGGFTSLLRSMRFVDRKIFAFGRSAAMRFSVEVVATNGNTMLWEGVDVFEFDEHDRIRRVTSYYDPASLAALTTTG